MCGRLQFEHEKKRTQLLGSGDVGNEERGMDIDMDGQGYEQDPEEIDLGMSTQQINNPPKVRDAPQRDGMGGCD
jgi:hypothetical protein